MRVHKTSYEITLKFRYKHIVLFISATYILKNCRAIEKAVKFFQNDLVIFRSYCLMLILLWFSGEILLSSIQHHKFAKKIAQKWEKLAFFSRKILHSQSINSHLCPSLSCTRNQGPLGEAAVMRQPFSLLHRCKFMQLSMIFLSFSDLLSNRYNPYGAV